MVSANGQGQNRVRNNWKLNKSNCRGAGSNVISLSNPVWSEFSESVKVFIPTLLEVDAIFDLQKVFGKTRG